MYEVEQIKAWVRKIHEFMTEGMRLVIAVEEASVPADLVPLIQCAVLPGYMELAAWAES